MFPLIYNWTIEPGGSTFLREVHHGHHLKSTSRRHIGKPILSIDVYLLEVQSRSDLKRRTLSHFWRLSPHKEKENKVSRDRRPVTDLKTLILLITVWCPALCNFSRLPKWSEVFVDIVYHKTINKQIVSGRFFPFKRQRSWFHTFI